MSAATTQQAGPQAVTAPRTIQIPVNSPSDLPKNYCQTPGGTMFSTTPGGTRLIYDRKFLLERRNSPLCRTPPKNMANIPGVTLNQNSTSEISHSPDTRTTIEEEPSTTNDDQFEMDL